MCFLPALLLRPGPCGPHGEVARPACSPDAGAKGAAASAPAARCAGGGQPPPLGVWGRPPPRPTGPSAMGPWRRRQRPRPPPPGPRRRCWAALLLGLGLAAGARGQSAAATAVGPVHIGGLGAEEGGGFSGRRQAVFFAALQAAVEAAGLAAPTSVFFTGLKHAATWRLTLVGAAPLAGLSAGAAPSD